MGVGGHIDHLATLLCIRNSLTHLSKAFNIYFYEDLPYASNLIIRQIGLSRFLAYFDHKIKFLNKRNILNEILQAEKNKLISIYESQHEGGSYCEKFSITHNDKNNRYESIWSLVS